MLFKGTKEGFFASKFHEKCDNQGSVIAFILNEHGQVFGAFTSKSFTSPKKPEGR